jgi:hypothetical protein
MERCREGFLLVSVAYEHSAATKLSFCNFNRSTPSTSQVGKVLGVELLFGIKCLLSRNRICVADLSSQAAGDARTGATPVIAIAMLQSIDK